MNLRENLFLATKKANGRRSTKAGRSTRTYDEPKTPYQRLREEAGFLGDDAEHRLQVLYAQIKPGRPDLEHQPDPASPHPLRQGQDPHSGIKFREQIT